ncbi:hypothetical protein GGS26DRAFT_599538 [Hypomontagnella submonticulosa]|nr:hypothetical protein GGS26DRAFT_599538 [Hypomontagnella submonticulosa]
MADLPIPNPGEQAGGPMRNVPPEILLNFIQYMEPEALFNMAMAFPGDWLDGPKVEIGELDGKAQALFRPSNEVPEAVPYPHLAVELGCPLWFIKRLIEGSERHCPGAINGIYPVPRRTWPLLHHAVSNGRVDVVNYLLTLPNIDHSMRVSFPNRPGDCLFAPHTHTGNCAVLDPNPQQANPNAQQQISCLTAVEVAIFGYGSLTAITGFDWRERRQRIEDCALILIHCGHIIPPVGMGFESLRLALSLGMHRYAHAMVRRTVELPDTDPGRQELLDSYFRNILFSAVEFSASELTNYILDLAMSDQLPLAIRPFPLPPIEDIFRGDRNPISVALYAVPARSDEAARILGLLREPLLRAMNGSIEMASAYASDMIRLAISLNAFNNHNHTFIAALFDYVHNYLFPLLDQLPNLRQEWQDYMDRVVDNAFDSFSQCDENIIFAIKNYGYGTPQRLRKAASRCYLSIFRAIMDEMLKRGESLTRPIPFRDIFEHEWSHKTPLASCIERGFLMGIVELLNQDVDPSTESPATWKPLADSLQWVMTLQTDPFRTSMINNYFEGPYTPSGSSTIDASTARDYFEIVVQIARRQAGYSVIDTAKQRVGMGI